MNYQIVYILLQILLAVFAYSCFVGSKSKESYQMLRIKRNGYKHFVDYLKERINQQEISSLLNQSGFKMSSVQYQLFRYMVFIVWVIMLNIFYYLKGGDYPRNELIAIIIIFFIASPTSYLLGRRTPFKILMDIFSNNYNYKKNLEIYRGISQIKNIAIIRRDNPLGSDFILEQLRKFTRIIRPEINKMIALWSMGERELACSYFEEAVGTKEALELANIFRKLDDLNPHELISQIILLQETIKKERETKKLKANEDKSNLVYLVVIGTSVIIMINFIVMVYYLETLQQLKYIQ